MIKENDVVTFPYPSLASLRNEHEKLMSLRHEHGETAASLQRTAAFIKNGRQAGIVIETAKNRHAAQSMLDYWDNLLSRAGYAHENPTLLPFNKDVFPPLADSACPYLGLDAFREEDNYHFFGRQLLIQEMLEHLESNPLLVVLGPSGSGKSSVVLAGLLPALKTGGNKAIADAVYLPPIVPGSTPLESLARALRPPNAPSSWVREQVAQFRVSDTHLLHLVRANALREKGYEAPTVLLIDQFEELFTLCTDRFIREQFVNNLETFFLEESANHSLIITMRSDFESQATDLEQFYLHFQNAIVNIPPLSLGELRDAIEKPAEMVGLKFQDGVVDALLKDILGEPAALPLLQFTLLKLWEKRERRFVTWNAYKSLSGGREALSQSATDFYDSLIPEDQQTVKHILLQMVVPSEGFEVTSRRVRRSTLFQTGEDATRVARVLQRLIDERLVRVSEGDAPEDQQVEIAHEALVRNWRLLVEWLEDVREEKRRRLRLKASAEAWKANEYDDSALLRGMMLQEAAKFPDLDELEIHYINESALRERQLQDEKQAARQRELDQAREIAQKERRLAREQKARADEQDAAAGRLRKLVYLLGCFFFIVAALALYGNRTAVRAKESENNAIIQQSAAIEARDAAQVAQAEAIASAAEAEAARGTAEALRVEAEVARDAEAESAAAAVVLQLIAEESATEAEEAKELADYNADQARLAQLEAEREVRRVASFSIASDANAQTSELRLLLALEAVSIPLLARDAVPPAAEEALFSALQEFQLAGELVDHADAVTDVAYSEDGRFIATASRDGTVKVWDAASGQETFTLNSGGQAKFTSLAFSNKGTYLAAGSDTGFVFFFDYMTGAQISAASNEEGYVQDVAFSPDGERMIVAHGNAEDGTFRVWNVSNIRRVRSLYIDQDHHTSAVLDVAFSQDGTRFATSDSTGVIQIFSFDEFPTRIGTLGDTTSGRANAIAFHPQNDDLLVAANQDKSVSVWNVAQWQLEVKWVGHSRDVNDIVFNSDGSRLVSVSDDSTAKVWNVASGQALYTLVGHRGSVRAVAFDPNGEQFVTASDDSTANIWNVEPGITPFILTGHASTIQAVATGSDSSMMITGGDESTIRLWDMENGRLLDTNTIHNGSINVVAFHPYQPLFITGGSEQIVYIWQINDANLLEFVQSFDRFSSSIVDASFHPTQPWILTTTREGRVQIWHRENEQAPLVSLETDDARLVQTAVFNHDGTQIATGDTTGQIIVWEIEQSDDELRLVNPFPINIHTAAINDLRFSQNGERLFSASDDKIAQQYNLLSSMVEKKYSGHNGSILQLDLDEENGRLATASSDGTVKLWNIELGQTIRTFLGHTAAVNSVAFSVDGAQLVTGSSDRTAQLFTLEPIDQLFERGQALVSRPLTETECNQYLPEGFERVPPLEGDNTIKCFTQKLPNSND